jgi:hypothetical protein
LDMLRLQYKVTCLYELITKLRSWLSFLGHVGGKE